MKRVVCQFFIEINPVGFLLGGIFLLTDDLFLLQTTQQQEMPMAKDYKSAVQSLQIGFYNDLIKRGLSDAISTCRVYAASWCSQHVQDTRRTDANPHPRLSDAFDFTSLENDFNKILADGILGCGTSKPVGVGPAVAAATFFMLLQYQEDPWDGNLK